MTRSSNKKLVTPYEEPERVIHSTRKLFKTTSLDYSSSPELDLFFDPEDQFDEENTETMRELTMEEYMNKIREDYGLGIARPKVDEKARFELNGKFLIQLRDNAFSGTNGEDSVEHIEKFLKIVDSLDIPNVTHDQLRFSVFPISLIGGASKWLMDETDSSITTWVDLTEFFLGNTIHLLVLAEIWKLMKLTQTSNGIQLILNSGIGEEVMKRNDTDIFHFENHLCKAFKEFNYLLKISDDGAQKNKEWFDEHELMEDDNDDIGDLEDYLIQKDPPYYVNEENERSKEIRCKLLGIPYVKPPTCKSKTFKVIKYSFGPAEEYVAIKEYEYDIWVRTEENVSHVYHDIFCKKNEGWSVTRTK
ncbi:hypothetical protein Tco_0058533 [Tanacetum coccineum]